MGQLRWTRASAFDLLEALDDGGRPMRWRRSWFGKMARQVSEGAAVTCRDADGRLVLVTGLYPEDGHAEAWFWAGPALRANLLPAVRQWRRIFDTAAVEAAPIEVRAFVHPKGVAGAKLASWLGFDRVGLDETGPVPLVEFRRKVERDAGDQAVLRDANLGREAPSA